VAQHERSIVNRDWPVPPGQPRARADLANRAPFASPFSSPLIVADLLHPRRSGLSASFRPDVVNLRPS
jgi:hypothetical protein